MSLNYKTTADIKVSKTTVEQIIGQEEAVKTIKKAALQRRNVLLIGEPGTGKSLTGQALAELLPDGELVDIISLPNAADENNPIIRTVPKGQGKELVSKAKLQVLSSMKNQNILFFILVIFAMLAPWWVRKLYGDIIAAATIISSMMFLATFVLFMSLNRKAKLNANVPKLLVDNGDKKKAAFIDATGAHAGALLGDVLHDPLQSFYYQSVVTETITQKHTQQLLLKNTQLNKMIDDLFLKKKELINENGYDATFLEHGELNVLGEENNSIESANVLSVNRYVNKSDYLIKIKTDSGKELTVTPEHKVAVKRFGKIFYKEAKKLTRFDKIIALDIN